MTAPARTGSRLRFRPISEVAPRVVTWLWEAWLAGGELALLEGDPGMNKSRLALDLCARLSRGQPMPDGTPGSEAAGAIFVNVEDSSARLTRPRLEAQGADMSRVLVLDDEADDLAGVGDTSTLADALHEALTRTGARLVVLDPVTDFLGPAVSLPSETSVRQALAPLRRLARQHDCAILMIRHLNKEESGRALYRGVGSIAFVAVCRLCWVVGPDPDDPTRWVLAQQKNTYRGKQPSRLFQVERAEGQSEKLTWLGESACTNDRLLGRPERAPRLAPALERARAFLVEFLKAGPRLSDDVWRAAQELGLSDRTVGRAKPEAQVRCVRTWSEGQCRSYWMLPGQQLPDGLVPEGGPRGLEKWLAPLRQEFPAANPLDDSDDV